MKIKKLLAVLLSVAMVIGMLPTTGLAEYKYGPADDQGILTSAVTSEEQLPRLSFELLDLNYDPITKEAILENAKQGTYDKFYLAVRAYNFTNFAKMSTHGLTKINVPINVNKSYLSIEPSGGSALASRMSLLYNGMSIPPYVDLPATWPDKNSVYKNPKPATPSGSSSPGKYEMTGDYTTVDNRIVLTVQPSQGLVSNSGAMYDDEYLGLFELQFTGLPSDSDMDADEFNRKVINFGVRTEDKLEIAMGDNTNGGISLAYHGNDSSLQDYLVLDASAVNFFPTMYTVTYDANAANCTGAKFKDGATTTEKVEENTAPTGKFNNGTSDVEISSQLEAPDGYVFAGWHTHPVNDTPISSTTKITQDTTVYAHYEEGYSVTFDANSGEFTDNETTKKITVKKTDAPLGASDTVASKVGTVEKTNYDFLGWFEKDDSGAFTAELDESDLKSAISESKTYYAMWKADDATAASMEYTLEFNKNGGTTEANPQTVPFSDLANDTLESLVGGLPVAPTAPIAGYTLKGWYKNKIGTGDALAQDSVLGTYTGLTASSDPKTSTVYAIWSYEEDDAVTLHYNLDGGKYKPDVTAIPDQKIKTGAPVPGLPADADMTKENKAFGGWYTAANGGGTKVEATTNIDAAWVTGGEITLYANWLDQATVTYDLNGLPLKTGKEKPQDQTGTPGSAFTVSGIDAADIEDDHEFVEWNTAANGSGTTYTVGDSTKTIPSEGLTLYAIWKYDETKADAVKVVFNGNDTDAKKAILKPNDANEASDASVANADVYTMVRKAGETITSAQLPTATREDYNFNHWGATATEAATSPVPDPQPAIDTTGLTGTVNKYAVWTPKTDKKITISFNLDGATSPTSITSVELASGDSLGVFMPENPSKTGFGFDGWMKSTDGSEYDDTKKVTKDTTFDADTEVKAFWKAKVTLTYDMNGLTGPTAPTEDPVVPGTEVKVKAFPTTGVPADHTITEWNTAANGTGDSYAPDDNFKVDEDTTLYAIWTYDETKTDAVKVVFNGNDTKQYRALLKLNDANEASDASVTNANVYTMVRKAGETITKAQMPTATRTKYTFNHWNASPTAATVATDGDSPTIAVAAQPDNKPMTVYAIWKVTDPNDEITISFDTNGSAGKPTSPDTVTAVTIATGDSLGNLMPTVTRNGFKLLGWTENSEAAYSDDKKVTNETAFDSDKTIKAHWAEKIELTFDANNGTVDATFTDNPTLNKIELFAGESVSERAEDPKKLPVVERTGYTFEGWFYKDGDNLVQVEDTTKVTESHELKAKWSAEIEVVFTSADFTYDNTAKTPVTDSNIKVVLAGTTTEISGFTTADFTTQYKVKGADDSTLTATVPKNAGNYNIDMELVKATLGTDLFTEYTLSGWDDEYTIKKKGIDYTLSNNYQYKESAAGIESIVLEKTNATETPTSDITDLFNNDDISIKFTNTDASAPAEAKEFENQMPTAFGTYTIAITAKDGSNFSVGTITDKLAADGGDGKLHLIPTTRQVKVVYGDGKVKDTTDSEHIYTTVKIPVPAKVTEISAAKTTLADQTEAGIKTDLPVEGTDFTPPDTKTILKFVVDPADASAPADTDTEFTKNSDIPAGIDPIVVYAVYKDAQWTLTFKDSKTTSPDDDIVYTMNAGKTLDDADGILKIDGTDATTEQQQKFPTMTPPDNKMLYGWTTEKAYADNSITNVVKADDIDASKIFAKTGKPAAGASGVTVYAVYVASDDATLKAASFNEKTAGGALIPYKTDDTYKTDATYDKDDADKTYYLIATNDADVTAFTLETEQDGATVKVTYTDNTGATPETKNVTTKTGTIPLDVAKNKSNNTITVEVTAPDGKTKETYTFHILRQAEAKVSFEYGNSPYGAIYSEPGMTDDWKEEAIKQFNDGGAPNKFKTGYVPTGYGTIIRYTPEAWVGTYVKNQGTGLPVDSAIADKIADPTINLDRDPYAIFAYERTDVYDTGFTAVNALGEDLTDKVVRSTTVRRIANFNRNYDDSADDWENDADNKITFAAGSDNNISKLTASISKSGESNPRLVRPGVYELKYECTDTFTGLQITDVRKIIVLPNIGDVNMQDGVMMSDTIAVIAEAKDVTKKIMDPNTAGDIANLFVYRVADTNMQDGITMADTISIIKEAKQGASGKMANFYVNTKAPTN